MHRMLLCERGDATASSVEVAVLGAADVVLAVRDVRERFIGRGVGVVSVDPAISLGTSESDSGHCRIAVRLTLESGHPLATPHLPHNQLENRAATQMLRCSEGPWRGQTLGTA